MSALDDDRVPARHLRNWLLAWHLHTGDPPDVIARGFDLDLWLVEVLLGARPPLMIARADAQRACAALRIELPELWHHVVAGAGAGVWEEIPEPLRTVFDTGGVARTSAQ